jgi:3-deoxy-manno-octulosonate cytidylyltransferase (CMP-KDO synthetase)
MSSTKVVIVIPARLKSSRFPNKLLQQLGGKTILQRTWERCMKIPNADAVFIAVDDELLQQEAQRLGAKWIMTSIEHKNGTERIAEVAEKLDFDIYVDVQGDEPFINYEDVEKVIDQAKKAPQEVHMLISKIERLEDAADPTIVKALVANNNTILVTSRAIIPCSKEGKPVSGHTYYQCNGVYTYTREVIIVLLIL